MNLLHLGLVILGAISFLAWKGQRASAREDFKFKIFLKKNVFVTVLNLGVGIGAVASNFIQSVQINGTELGEFWWFTVGAFGHLFFVELQKTFTKKPKE